MYVYECCSSQRIPIVRDEVSHGFCHLFLPPVFPHFSLTTLSSLLSNINSLYFPSIFCWYSPFSYQVSIKAIPHRNIGLPRLLFLHLSEKHLWLGKIVFCIKPCMAIIQGFIVELQSAKPCGEICTAYQTDIRSDTDASQWYTRWQHYLLCLK